VDVSIDGKAFATRVYKVKDDSIILLANLDDYDTGYTSESIERYKLKIWNKFATFAFIIIK
jgi:hypothetical protein